MKQNNDMENLMLFYFVKVFLQMMSINIRTLYLKRWMCRCMLICWWHV